MMYWCFFGCVAFLTTRLDRKAFHASLPKEVLQQVQLQINQMNQMAINVQQQQLKVPNANKNVGGAPELKTAVPPSTGAPQGQPVRPIANEPAEVAVEGTEKESAEGETTIESVFVKMKPSEHRYTLLHRDEL